MFSGTIATTYLLFRETIALFSSNPFEIQLSCKALYFSRGDFAGSVSFHVWLGPEYFHVHQYKLHSE